MRDTREHIGVQLANVAFNWAQQCGHTLTSDDCAMLDKLRKQWDAAPPVPAARAVDAQPVAWSWQPSKVFAEWDFTGDPSRVAMLTHLGYAVRPLYAAPPQQPQLEQVTAVQETIPPRPAGLNGADTDPTSPLERWGKPWHEGTELMLQPVPDGYWTPWHVANEKLRDAQSANAAPQSVAPVQPQPSAEWEALHKFLDAAAGEGLELDGVDAGDLCVALFPEKYADAIDSAAKGEA